MNLFAAAGTLAEGITRETGKMTFSPLEMVFATILGSIITGIVIKLWADNAYMKKEDCQKCASRETNRNLIKNVKVLKAWMAIVMEKQGISQLQQQEIAERAINLEDD